ncbi:transcription repressor OFP17-like [Trifolium pratense]|uniref:transcription repressor OFP17-like n=1 Tax=Trifolium pratense TaxID=57577 RepID=UPI001E6967B3|nr:transcription repressor OFP17-like [Trifolium pratense]
MKVKALSIFKSKFLKPCKKLIFFFKLKPKKLVFKRALRKSKSKKPSSPSKPMSSFLSVFCSPKKSKDYVTLPSLKSPSNVHETPIFPSPLTPARVRTNKKEASKSEASSEEVEDACRSFENYLAEMIVEEGKPKDLMDVEELLYCWKNLKCPVFIGLVSRFYGELCKDLFSPDNEEYDKLKK